ncbi:MAG: hypothetical protein J0H14_07040 [Alphaproteobacteria bacterium]|nr:hypothetical protein [Rhodospirillales bacterium]MBN9560472.1 hypothetical protein [Alphaproteobacteria bacterium]
MNQTVAPDASQPRTEPSTHIPRSAACVLLAVSIVYAVAGSLTVPQQPVPIDAAYVFFAGAIPGLLIMLLLLLGRPRSCDRQLRCSMVGLTVFGAAMIAALPFIVATL